MEFWLHGFAVPGRVADLARRAEAWGFTGLLLADSQSLTADVWVELCLAAAATSRLRVGPGVTNPVTRHLAVTASAAGTPQVESGGRVSLGIGQGDSALSQIGLRALRVHEFEQAIETLQGLLRGEETTLGGGAKGRIRWLDTGQAAKVPVHVGASGPRTIAAAARHAEGVDLTVGAELERLAGRIAIAREAAPAGIEVGAYLNVAVDSDPTRARELVRGSVATFARFSAAVQGYEADRHGEARAGFAQELTDEFIDAFAVAGPAQHVRARLTEIARLGIDRVVVVPGSLDSDPEAVIRSCDQLAPELTNGPTASPSPTADSPG